MLRANGSLKRPLGIVLLISLLTLLAGCTPSHPQSTFDTLGPVSESQKTIFFVIFWLGAAVFVIVEGAIIYAVLRYRRRGDGDPVQTHGNTALELTWTIIPALILVPAAIFTLQGIFFDAAPPDNEADLIVEATGHQWWFEFEYVDLDVVTANELHIPVGKSVKFKLDSVDVIHSFWVPKLAGKVDMVPNNENSMWFQADEPGVFFGQCAEFCGVSHANMRFKVVAESQADFDAWVSAQAANAFAPADDLTEQGQEVFMSRDAGCSFCHTVKGTGAGGEVGPNLTHVASRRDLAAGMFDNTEDSGDPSKPVLDSILQGNLRTWLSDPGEVKPGNIMAKASVYTDPARALDEEEISALVAYLTSLK